MTPLTQLLRLTLLDPRAAARVVIGLNLPLAAAWTALALTTVLAAILSHLTITLMGGPQAEVPALFSSPLLVAGVQGGVQAVGAVLAWAVGRRAGGHGTLAQAVALFAWLEAVLLVAQAAQFLLTVPAPGLAEVIGIMSFALFLWLLTVFVAELHGFVRPGLVLLSILATGFVLALVVAIVLVAVFGAEGVSGV